MSALLPFLLHGLHEYGYPVLWLTIFIAAVGLPLPASLVLLAAGAFAAHGVVNIALLMGITITASSCGDSLGYFIGRRWGSKTLRWFGQPRWLQLIPARTITRSRLLCWLHGTSVPKTRLLRSIDPVCSQRIMR